MAFVIFHTARRVAPMRTSLIYSATRCRETSSVVTLALSEPQWRSARVRRLFESAKTSGAQEPQQIPGDDYNAWSSDFVELCNAQLCLLMSTISHLAHVALFFRHENPHTGALEFIPLIVHASEEDGRAERVWISSGAGGQTELEDAHTSKALPGGIPAEWILPDYPFKEVGEEGGILMADGALCIPIEYNNVLAGSVVLMPKSDKRKRDGADSWTHDDIKRADMVARSIALGAALEGKWHANEGRLGTSRSVIESVRSLLRTTLHQMRSPISALVTFGHLLLRKLPPGDANRDLAKNIILEALRVDELLEPLDNADHTLFLPEVSSRPPSLELETSSKNTAEPTSELENRPLGLDFGSLNCAGAFESNFYGFGPSTSGLSLSGKQLLWLADVLLPLVDVYAVLASEKGMHFFAQIDDDSPAVMANEKGVREMVCNLLDNALNYCASGDYVGITCRPSHDKSHGTENEINVVEVTVWDTGPGIPSGERDRIWEHGFRGGASLLTNASGSGYGLAIVKDMVNALGATVDMNTPLTSCHDAGYPPEVHQSATPGSAFTIRFPRSH